ncbi:neuromedin-U receptor 2-like [Lampetra fluviatilis]
MMGDANATPHNLTHDELLLRERGRRQSDFFVPICLSYSLILAVGVGGNVLTCIVIASRKGMKTPTNFYLFSLAISDLLVLLLGMPLEIYEMWSNYPFLFGRLGCYFRTALFETVCFASVLNVTALSLERYVAVVHPLRARSSSTRRRAVRVIAALWLLSGLLSLPNTLTHDLNFLVLPDGSPLDESAVCTVVHFWPYKYIVAVTAFLFYVLPMALISVLYCLMGLELREEKLCYGERRPQQTDQPGSAGDNRLSVQRPPRRTVTKMLFVLVLVFGLCWAPFHVDRLFYSFVTKWTETLALVFNTVHIMAGVLFYLSSAVNPIIYNLLSTRFRAAFRELLFRQLSRSTSLGSSPAKLSLVNRHSLTALSGQTLNLGELVDLGCPAPLLPAQANAAGTAARTATLPVTRESIHHICL